MRILVLSATDFEIAAFRKQFPDAELLITGVGMMQTIYFLTKMLLQKKYDLVIQVGIAGSFDENLKFSELVVVEKDRFGDLGMMEKGEFKSVAAAGFSDADSFPFIDEWLVNKVLIEECELPKVNGITVNRVSDDLIEFPFSLKNTIETMEGAALHYVCLQENIPFLQIRSISNIVGDRNKQNWKISDAIESLNNYLISMYKKLK